MLKLPLTQPIWLALVSYGIIFAAGCIAPAHVRESIIIVLALLAFGFFSAWKNK